VRTKHIKSNNEKPSTEQFASGLKKILKEHRPPLNQVNKVLRETYPYCLELTGIDEDIITSEKSALHMFNSLVKETERRFQVFADARVRNISEYQEKQMEDQSLEKIPGTLENSCSISHSPILVLFRTDFNE